MREREDTAGPALEIKHSARINHLEVNVDKQCIKEGRAEILSLRVFMSSIVLEP